MQVQTKSTVVRIDVVKRVGPQAFENVYSCMEKRSRNHIESSCANRQIRPESNSLINSDQTPVDRQRLLRLKQFIKRDDKISKNVAAVNNQERAQQQLKNKFSVHLSRGLSAEVTKSLQNRSKMTSLVELPNNSVYPGLETGFRATRERFCATRQKHVLEGSDKTQAYTLPQQVTYEELDIGQVSIHQSIGDGKCSGKVDPSKNEAGTISNWRSTKTMTGTKWRIKTSELFLPKELFCNLDLQPPTTEETASLGSWQPLLDNSWILPAFDFAEQQAYESKGGTYFATFTPKRLEQSIGEEMSVVDQLESVLVRGKFTILLKSKV